jgi:hypothetical protein
LATIILPSWENIEELLGDATESLTICTPFYTEEGLGRLLSKIPPPDHVDFWTRLRLADWLHGSIEPGHLYALLSAWEEAGSTVRLGLNRKLHAKIYLANSSNALVGSANLTSGGFDNNLETMIQFKGEEVNAVRTFVEGTLASRMTTIQLTKFKEWIKEHSEFIEEVRAKRNDQEEEGLAEVQRELDKLLGYGNSELNDHFNKNLDTNSKHEFITWLNSHKDLQGARPLIRYFEGYQNRSGHASQCYFGVRRFLEAHPEIKQVLNDYLVEPETIADSNGTYQPSSGIRSVWCDFLDTNATEYIQGVYDFGVLRGCLPGNLGGYVEGGGGASGILKRELPLVARFCVENHL